MSPTKTLARSESKDTNTHYRWVAQLWSTEECWLHAPKGEAQLEDSNAADRFRDCPSAATRSGRSFPGFLRSRHWIPPQLYWPAGERREESLPERSLQLVASSRSRPFAIVASGRETTGAGEVVSRGLSNSSNTPARQEHYSLILLRWARPAHSRHTMFDGSPHTGPRRRSDSKSALPQISWACTPRLRALRKPVVAPTLENSTMASSSAWKPPKIVHCFRP